MIPFNTIYSKIWKIIFTSLLVLLISATVYSQKPFTPEHGDPLLEPWRWSTFNELANKGLRCVAQTADSDMWFGTEHGIIRYNGKNWTEYNESNGFTNEYISTLLVTSKNIVYAGSNKGLFKFQNNRWYNIIPFPNKSKIDKFRNVYAIIEIPGLGVLACIKSSEECGLLLIRENSLIFYVSKQLKEKLGILPDIETVELPDDKCTDKQFLAQTMYIDSKNRIWVSMGNESKPGPVFYMQFDQQNIPKATYSKKFTPNTGFVISKGILFSEDNKGNIWVFNGEFNKGINIYNGRIWRYIKNIGDNSHYSACNIDGNMWIGGFGCVYIWKGNNVKVYARPQSAVPSSVIKLFKDKNNNIWILGQGSEVIKVDYSGTHWNSYKNLNFQCDDNQNNSWFTQYNNKVVVKADNRWYYYDANDQLPDAPAKIFCTKKGIVCVAGSYQSQACISFYVEKKWKRYTFPNLSWGIDGRAVFEDRDGNLWIGASVNANYDKGHKAGVVCIRNPGSAQQKATHYLPQDGIRMGNAYGFAQTKDGTIWLAGSHLCKFSNNKWQKVRQPEEVTNFINAIGNTPEGSLWLGTRFHGVFRYDGNTWTKYTINDGLLSDRIISILTINEQNVWVATDIDISRFDGTSWSTAIFSDNITLTREGGEILRQPDGTIWINKSTREWKRRALYQNKVEPDIPELFSTLSYMPDSLPPDTKINVYTQNVSSDGNTFIQWSSTIQWNKTSTDKIQYSYKINNGQWSAFSKQNNVTLLGLKNGKYTFSVRARDIDFDIDPTPATIEFRVAPPVWKQVWFIALILLFLAIVAYYQYITLKQKKILLKTNKKLEKRQEEISKKNIILEEQKEQILQQNIIEKESTQARLRFFTNISHEFRTPLSIISGMVENITQNKHLEKQPELKKQFMSVRRNTHTLLKLINQLMDFRKLEADSMQLNVSEGNIVEFIEGICYSFMSFAQVHGINLSFQSEYDRYDMYFDNDKMEKIMHNLISNAIRFTSDGGFVNIIIRNESNKQLLIVVEDSGIGIPSDEINKIFDPFFQVNHNKSRVFEGTGIGLSIVAGFVSLHHGTLQVDSSTDNDEQLKKGYSTRFSIHIPTDSEIYSIKEKTSNAKSQTNNNSETDIEISDEIIYDEVDILEPTNTDNISNRPQPLILVVEDNTDLRKLIAGSLKDNFSIIEASDGSDGFDKCISHMPDLIVSDVMMPKTSGIALCRRTKTDQRTSHIPVILLTARTADEQKIEGFDSGADDFLTKPFSIPLLTARINNILSIRANLRRIYLSNEPKHVVGISFSTVDDALLYKVKNVIEQNIGNEKMNVEYLCREIGLSNRHLQYKLQNLIGMSPVEYIRFIKLNQAAQMLLNPSKNISEVALETGFSDSSYFGKCFLKQFKMTPKEYLNKHSKTI